MPRHPNAIGYLNDLASEVGEPWFTMICDLAAIAGVSSLTPHHIDVLSSLFKKQSSYLAIRPLPSSTAALPAASIADFLESLSGFSNFKLLQNTLQVTLPKRITLIFGTNGSGKSSLCESLKVLASPEQPSRPLHNVRVHTATSPSFSFKFKSDASSQTWSPSTGYGSRQQSVKYFDAGIAVKNVKDSVEPGRIIVLTPFKIHVFEWAQSLTSQFRDALQQEKLANATSLAKVLELIRTRFEKFKARPLAFIDEASAAGLATEIAIGKAFAEHELLKQKQALAVELERGASEEGLKLLKAEHRELEAFLPSIEILLNSAEELWALHPVTKTKELAAKEAAQVLIAKELIPSNGTLENLRSLINAASPLCSFDALERQACPLCKRVLTEPEVALFKRYHELLAGELEAEITVLCTDLARAEELVRIIKAVPREEWGNISTISKDTLDDAKAKADVIVLDCGLANVPSDEAIQAVMSLKMLLRNNERLLEQKSSAIEAAAKGRDEVTRQLSLVNSEIEPLDYAQCISASLGSLREAHEMGLQANFWNTKLPTLTPLLKKITDGSKRAYEDLVVSDFEARLNSEYQALTNKPMAAFGIKLARKGSDATVTVLPQIGDNEIDWVLSEGEKRVHALALFFAELDSCSQSVIVFDDPVSSFDYDYIANYCRRLRDFLLSHPTNQIIVLTHNWEFFVQLQTTLNLARLDGNYTVQVIENCSVIADYTEKVDELKADIGTVLVQSGEPTRAQKEEIAGKLRRLIEAIVNTHVFNKQRYQYKQKSSQVSDFPNFTKLVPLLPAEATTLRDLYADLSITEHDDLRNAYVNTNKATFQARYDKILAVETALISRKP